MCLKTTNKNVIRKITNEILLRLRTTTSLLTLVKYSEGAASADPLSMASDFKSIQNNDLKFFIKNLIESANAENFQKMLL